MTVLVIAPHPDDEILGCGGVIAKRAEAGDDVWVCIVSEGKRPMYSRKFIEQEFKESRYDEVQEVINHIYSASAQELADEVWTGKYGDDEVRRTVLGDRWQEVQDIVNDGGKKYHTIESGETLTSIAKDFGTTVDALVSLNGIENPNLIITGDSIRVR